MRSTLPLWFHHDRRLQLVCAAVIALLLAGCESVPTAPELPSVPAIVEVDAVNAGSDMTDRVGQAAITPLSDLNVVQQKIPEVLRNAKKVGPYALPENLDCHSVQGEINRLTVALGADLDDPTLKGKPSLFERGTDAAENYGVGFVRRTVEGLVPFRSWVRKLSGAEKHSKEVASTIMAGGVRRAYLKGMRQGMGCPILAPQKADKATAAVEAAAPASDAPSAPTATPSSASGPANSTPHTEVSSPVSVPHSNPN